MRAVERSLESLYETTDSFVVTGGERVLHVATSLALRLPVLQVLASFEYHPASAGPWFFAEATDDPLGWDARAEEIELQWLPRTDPDADPAFPPLAAVAAAVPTGQTAELAGLPRFVERLQSASASLPDRFDELVVVLAPARVRDSNRWVAELRALLLRTTLTSLRFVVVDVADPISTPAFADFQVLTTDVRLDRSRVAAEQRTCIEAAVTAFQSVASSRTAPDRMAPRPFGAGPDDLPPTRPDQPVATAQGAESAWRVAGVPDGLMPGGPGHAAHVLALRAGLAVLDERPGDAAVLQEQACERLDAAGLFAEAGSLALMQALYHQRAGAPERAGQILERTLERAENMDEPLLVAKAQMILAGLRSAAGEHGAAAACWSHAAGYATLAGFPSLAVEAWRVAGQIFYGLGRSPEAQDAYENAIASVETDRDEAPYTSAPEAALALASLLYEQGDRDRAFSYRELAETLAEPRE